MVEGIQGLVNIQIPGFGQMQRILPAGNVLYTFIRGIIARFANGKRAMLIRYIVDLVVGKRDFNTLKRFTC